MSKHDRIIVGKLSRLMKYTVKDLRVDFPDEEACLEWLVAWLHPDGITCKKCGVVTKHYKDKRRRSYSCSRCGNHFHPTAGTICHNTHIPLTDWFYAIYMMSTNKAGTSAKQIQRELGCSYSTAWRMMHKIRSLMGDKGVQLSGEVEIDETYVHPNTFKRSSASKRFGHNGSRTGEVVFGMVERGGHVKVRHVMSAGKRVLQPHIDAEVAKDAVIYTDESFVYRDLHRRGWRHFTTNHGRHEHVNRTNHANHTQNIENVWSHLKRGIKGVYRHIEPKYLQNYANEYAWRYSHRNAVSMFWALLGEFVVETPASNSSKTVS
jgi:transposase